MRRVNLAGTIGPHHATAGAIVLAFTLAAPIGARDGWLVQFGTSVFDNANSVAVDGHDVYVAGATGGRLDEPGSAAGQDIYLRQYVSNGQLNWTRQFGTAGPDGTTAGTVRARDRRVVVAGFVRGALPGHEWAGAEDLFVRMYDRQGTLAWSVQFGSAANERVRSVAIADDGSIFISGQTQGQLGEIPSAGRTDAFVARLAPNGVLLWLRQFGTGGVDEAIGVIATETAVFVTGATDGAFPGHTSAGDFDAFVAAMTYDGDFEWLSQFGTAAFDALWKIGVAGETLLAAGNTQGELDGETSMGGFDALVAGISLDGQVQWAHQFGSAGNDLALALAVNDGGAVAAGRMGGFLPPGGADPDAEAFARRYDAFGNVLWTIEFGTVEGTENAQDVALEDEDMYLVGITTGSLGSANAGSQDGYVRRIRGD